MARPRRGGFGPEGGRAGRGAGVREAAARGHVLGTGLRLGRVRHGQHEHRPGFDLTFSAPKSVSLAALLPTERHPRGDRSVVRAHDEAVRETLDWVEETFLETRGWDPETGRRPRVKAPFMVAATERLSVWGAAGYGAGELTLTPEGDPALKTDLGMMLAAAGARVALVGGEGPKLDAVTDGRWVRTTTARVSAAAGSVRDDSGSGQS